MTKNTNGMPVEIERKYLIDMPNISEIASIVPIRSSDITQTYLISSNGDDRVRKRVYAHQTVYTRTRKKPISDMSRIEIEEQIAEPEYTELIKNSDPDMATVHKTRYEVTYKSKCFEIDVYPFEKERAIMEIELNNESETFEFPPFVKILKEVTTDKDFSNKTIAKKLKSEPDSQIIPR